MNASVLIVLNSEIGDIPEVRRLAKSCPRRIFCDGAVSQAGRLGVEPDFVIGDMDSLPARLPRFSRKVTYWCDFDPNRCDFEKALALARRLGARKVFVAGALGGRIDHTLANLALVQLYCEKIEIVLIGGGLAQTLGRGRYKIPVKSGRTFSVLPVSQPALVSISAARYVLKRARLLPGSLGLGNVSRGLAHLTVHQGRVWLIVPKGT
jgi:thiamine pyrophosphokinase